MPLQQAKFNIGRKQVQEVKCEYPTLCGIGIMIFKSLLLYALLSRPLATIACMDQSGYEIIDLDPREDVLGVGMGSPSASMVGRSHRPELRAMPVGAMRDQHRNAC